MTTRIQQKRSQKKGRKSLIAKEDYKYPGSTALPRRQTIAKPAASTLNCFSQDSRIDCCRVNRTHLEKGTNGVESFSTAK